MVVRGDPVGDVRAAAHSFLDEATSETLYREGREMELEDTLVYALQQQEARPGEDVIEPPPRSRQVAV